jgi:hypothetical protein
MLPINWAKNNHSWFLQRVKNLIQHGEKEKEKTLFCGEFLQRIASVT